MYFSTAYVIGSTCFELVFGWTDFFAKKGKVWFVFEYQKKKIKKVKIKRLILDQTKYRVSNENRKRQFFEYFYHDLHKKLMKDDFFFFSFGDLSTKAIWEDVKYLIFGYFLVYFYVQVMLGRFNKVEQRVRNDDLQLFLFSSFQKFTFFIFVLSIN